jgi:aminoglycoside 6'-N-acetyltransferase I
MRLVYKKILDQEKIPYDLLLLADPSLEMIKKYSHKSIVYTINSKKELLGCAVLFPLRKQRLEIKAIAIKEKFQGKGLGTRMLQFCLKQAKSLQYKEIWIGTANSSIGQLYLYQKLGFELDSIRKNFFVRNYENPIWEKGIQAKHLLLLKRKI